MTLGFSSNFAPLLLSRALSRQLFVYAAVCLMTAQVLLIAMGINADVPRLCWTVGLLVIPGLILTVLMFWTPRPWVAALYITSAGTGLFATADVVLKLIPNQPSTALAPFALTSIATTLVSGAAVSVRGRVGWALAGFGVSTLALWAAAEVSHHTFQPDARAVIGALVIIAIAFIVPGQATLAVKAQEAFDASWVKIEEDGDRALASREAVARLHDTLLADLTVVTKINQGPLSPQLREALEMELAHLVSTDWLVAAIEKTEVDRREAQDTSAASDAFMAVIDDYLSLGLTVNVSGEISALAPLPVNSQAALVGAMGQCLSNVMAHSGIFTVDVVVLASGNAVTVTVIDGGVGFEPDAVDVDRLGLRVSVRSRIESVGGFVKIWSIPGQGTAIMLQLPYAGKA